MANDSPVNRPIPIILDTDIGQDIDDTWAIAMMLRCPELDVKLIVSDTGDTEYRARIVAKLLEVAGRTDIPVGVGVPCGHYPQPQAGWVEGYDLARYPGTVHQDGVNAMIETIMASPEPVTLIAIGPVPNLAEALRREPRIAQRARFVGMHGSICLNHDGCPGAIAEYNVEMDIPAAQAAFAADWPMTITPLDTCGRIRLTGEKYRKIQNSTDPILSALMDNYRIWAEAQHQPNLPEQQSTILYDTVAIYLAFADDLLVMDDLSIRVRDDGFTVVDPAGKPMRVAMDWKDLPGFEDFLVERLISPA
ncbi:MAG: nucleoside hydrolase [Phycisphaerae bacterium]|nr:nucleoside hydrolase [Phycisphaerae bacterium]